MILIKKSNTDEGLYKLQPGQPSPHTTSCLGPLDSHAGCISTNTEPVCLEWGDFFRVTFASMVVFF